MNLDFLLSRRTTQGHTRTSARVRTCKSASWNCAHRASAKAFISWKAIYVTCASELSTSEKGHGDAGHGW